MAEIVEHITDARDNGTINVYGVRYNQRGRTDNMAVALPGNPSFDFRHDFCANIIDFENARECGASISNPGTLCCIMSTYRLTTFEKNGMS